MSLEKKLQEDLKESMRSGNTDKRTVIRYIRAKIHDEEISQKAKLDDDSIIILLGKQAQQRRDSIESFEAGNRHDLAEREKIELEIILKYLPEQMSDQEISEFVNRALQDVQASGPQDMGKVMAHIMPTLRGKTDGHKVSKMVSQLLMKRTGKA